MRRVLLSFIAFLLPLQFAWGAVTAYCQHEAGAASRHFGHHEHVHQAEKVKPLDAGKWAEDNDCGICHGAGPTALAAEGDPAPAAFPHQPPLALAAHPPLAPPQEPPDRPQWTRLA